MTILFWIMVVWCTAEFIGFIYNICKDFDSKVFQTSGCNLFNSNVRYDCCVDHDKAYTRGGFFIARFKADWNLMSCIWKKSKTGVTFRVRTVGKLLAIVMFLGVRLFGMFDFEYGKKRNILYADGTVGD